MISNDDIEFNDNIKKNEIKIYRLNMYSILY